MKEVLEIIFWYIVIAWDFTWMIVFKRKGNKRYFWVQYKGILLAILSNGYSLSADWGDYEEEKN